MSRCLDCKVRKRKADIPRPGRYDYEGLAHWWVYNQGYVTTAGGKMSAEGTLLYSYNTVIARMFDPPNKGEQPFVLISSERYSNTTAKHINIVTYAVAHMNYVFVANPNPSIKEDHRCNLKMFLEEMEDLGLSYPRKRKESTKQAVIRRMTEIKADTEKYARYFKLRNLYEYKAIINFPMPDNNNDFTELVEQSVKDRVRHQQEAKMYEARKARLEHKKEVEKAKAKLKKWLKGEDVWVDGNLLERIYLRVKGGMIQTTRHAYIDIDDAIKAYLRFKEGKLSDGMHVGPYTFGTVDKDRIYIGCHIFNIQTIEDFMEKLISSNKKDRQ